MAICRYLLSLLPNLRFLSLDSELLRATVMKATGSAWQKRWFHLSMLFPHDLQCMLDQPVCSMLYIIARPDSPFLRCTCVYFLAWYSVAWDSVTFYNVMHSSSIYWCMNAEINVSVPLGMTENVRSRVSAEVTTVVGSLWECINVGTSLVKRKIKSNPNQTVTFWVSITHGMHACTYKMGLNNNNQFFHLSVCLLPVFQ